MVVNLVKNDPSRHRWSMYGNGSSNYDKGSGMYGNGSAKCGKGSANCDKRGLCMVRVPPTVVEVPLIIADKE